MTTKEEFVDQRLASRLEKLIAGMDRDEILEHTVRFGSINRTIEEIITSSLEERAITDLEEEFKMRGKDNE